MGDFVNVFLRVRPDLKDKSNENDENEYLDAAVSTDRMIVVDAVPYQFDRVFYKDASQDDVFHQMVEQKVQKVLQGFNCLVFAYGQSGAGKTYTIGLKDAKSTSDPQESHGIITKSIDYIFAELQKDPETAANTTVSVSFIEIYKEKAYDLLSPMRDVPIYQKGKHYQGSIKAVIHNSAEAETVIIKGNRNRHVRGTALNVASSRSHALFTIEIKNDKYCSVMNICDLAGSEGLRSTNHFGTPQAEGIEINKGLLALKRAIQELSNRKKVTSHRESVLTMILQSSLNLTSYFAIIGCITSNREDKTETQSTVRFLQDVKKLDSKAAPEVNAFREKQRAAKTPLRNYMMPTSFRNSSVLNKTPMDVNSSQMSISKTLNNTSLLKKRPLGSFMNRYNQPGAKKPRRGDVSSCSEASSVGSVELNTFNGSNCSTSTELEQASRLINATNQTNQFPQMSMQSIKIPSFSPYDRKMKMLEDQVKRYEQILFSAQNFQQFQQSMMFSANNYNDLNSTFNIHVDDEVNEAQPSHIRQQTTLAKRVNVGPLMNYSKMETTDYISTKENRAIVVEQPLNRAVFTHVNISSHSPNVRNNDAKPTRSRAPLATIQTRQSSRLEKKNQLQKAKVQAQKQSSKMMDINEVLSTPMPKSEMKKCILAIFNEGNPSDLQKIPTVGKKTATQIIVQRTKKAFRNIEDLRRVAYYKSEKNWNKLLAGVSL